MIKTKKDLQEYLEADARIYVSQQSVIGKWKSYFASSPISNQKYIWKYIKTMRYCEYVISQGNSIVYKIQKLFYLYLLNKYAYKTGFQIPPGTIDKGLTIYHWGMIIINEQARLGENCTLQPNIVIGKRKKNGCSPIIGDNVYICSGARILGDIHIGNNVTIAPNSVVVKNVEDNCVVAGNPAIVIKQNGKKVNRP